MSEGNAKTSLEQSPMRESPRPIGLHKSTVTTQRKSVQSVISVPIRVFYKGDFRVERKEGSVLQEWSYEDIPFICLFLFLALRSGYLRNYF